MIEDKGGIVNVKNDDEHCKELHEEARRLIPEEIKEKVLSKIKEKILQYNLELAAKKRAIGE